MSQLIPINESYKRREAQQEKLLLIALTDILEKNKKESDKLTVKLENKISKNDQETRELKQVKEILTETILFKNTVHQKTNRNFYFIISFLSVFIAIIISTTVFNIENEDQNIFSSNFLIQNLRGDTIDTWIAWKIVKGDIFHVNVKHSQYVTQERLDAISETIMSTKKLEISDSLLHKGLKNSASTYYVGWFGALNAIDDNTELSIPKNLNFDVTDKGEGDILIELSNLSNSDGYSGFTKAIVDDAENQILKSTITIYDIERLSTEQLKTILRHELGHGFGLAHSSAPEDLMAPTITSNYPYISECDLDAITLLYDGGESSQVICKK